MGPGLDCFIGRRFKNVNCACACMGAGMSGWLYE